MRNNSAWNHRWFLCFGRDELKAKGGREGGKGVGCGAAGGRGGGGGGGGVVVDEEIIDREVSFAQEKILLAPQNQSPWTYLRGLYRKSGRPLSDLKSFAEQFAGDGGETDDGNGDEDQEWHVDVEEGVRSSHALDLLADIYAEVGEKERARRTLEALGRRWDPVRKGYWDWRVALLDEDREDAGEGVAGVASGREGLSVS